MKKRLADEYILKSIYDDKINDYEQKLISYKNDYISVTEHQKQVAELEHRIKEESLAKERLSKEDYEQKNHCTGTKNLCPGGQKSRPENDDQRIHRIHERRKRIIGRCASSGKKKGVNSFFDPLRNQKQGHE